MVLRSKIRWFAIITLVVSSISIFVHLHLARYSTEDAIQYKFNPSVGDKFQFVKNTVRYRKLWGPVKSLEPLQPFANPRISYASPSHENNGYIYAKIYGNFEKIRSSICDLVTVARLLNATLVVPEIQQSSHSRGISSSFTSFSYLYNEEHFIAALTNDVIVVRKLPPHLKAARKKKNLPNFSPRYSTSPDFYIDTVLPKLRRAEAIGLVITGGGCLQSILPARMIEQQRLRCRVAFHALQFRSEIQELGHRIVERLRASGQPYLAFHPGLARDTLAYHGCAELFQDIHAELILYRRAQMVAEGMVREELIVNSHLKKRNGSCPLMPEEVGLLLRAVGYPYSVAIYVAGSEIFGGQRVLIPLRGMYTNLVDRTSLCSRKELGNLIGPESKIPLDSRDCSPSKSKKEHIEEWKMAGPRPRPLPPPPARPIYAHEREGWYGWVADSDQEPEPSALDLRMEAHRLLWDALDYVVSIEADAFFPGFSNDGGEWPNFSNLVMGHRLYEMASAVTYRPDRRVITSLFEDIREHLYYPKRNWTIAAREYLNRSIDVEGLVIHSRASKSSLFLSHPLPECMCRNVKPPEILQPVKGRSGEALYGEEDDCPEWMHDSPDKGTFKGPSSLSEDESSEEADVQDTDMIEQHQLDQGGFSEDQDEEMDPDD